MTKTKKKFILVVVLLILAVLLLPLPVFYRRQFSTVYDISGEKTELHAEISFAELHFLLFPDIARGKVVFSDENGRSLYEEKLIEKTFSVSENTTASYTQGLHRYTGSNPDLGNVYYFGMLVWDKRADNLLFSVTPWQIDSSGNYETGKEIYLFSREEKEAEDIAELFSPYL